MPLRVSPVDGSVTVPDMLASAVDMVLAPLVRRRVQEAAKSYPLPGDPRSTSSPAAGLARPLRSKPSRAAGLGDPPRSTAQSRGGTRWAFSEHGVVPRRDSVV